MLKKKRLYILLAVVMLFSIFAGSGCNAPYSATLYDNAKSWIKMEFREANPIKAGKYDGFPTRRIHVIKDKETYDNVFIENLTQLEVDFSEQMILVYHFWDYNRRENYLVDVLIENNVLLIVCEQEDLGDALDACQPYQRCYVLTMDKVEVDEIVFVSERYKEM